MFEFSTSDIVLGALAPIGGYIMWHLKRVESKIDASLTEPEIRLLIEDKLEPLKIKQSELKEDLNRMEDKIDYLIKLNIDK